MAEELHVLFVGGQVGQPLARILLARGKRVRIVKRSAGGLPESAELVPGDATNLNFCVEAARGASTVYHCMNPPYYARVWAELLPRYMENLIAAAGRNGARLVVLDNVYMLGRPQGKPLDEDTPPRPCSRKGEIRARVAERMLEAHGRGDVRAYCGAWILLWETVLSRAALGYAVVSVARHVKNPLEPLQPVGCFRHQLLVRLI
jgi:nucleoside-diphosphate-sugar epimerase